MRNRFIEFAIAVFAVTVAGFATVALVDKPDHQQPDTQHEIVTQPVDYEGGALAYVAGVQTFARAVDEFHAGELVALSAKVDADKAAARTKVISGNPPKGSGGAPAAPRVSGSGHGTPSAAYLACIGMRESGNNYGSVGGGRWGIIDSTWAAMGGHSIAPHSWLASPADQDAMMYRIYAASGPGAWSPYDGC